MTGLIEAIPVIVQSLYQMLPQIIETIITVFTNNIPVLVDGSVQLLNAIIDAIPIIIEALIPIIPTIVTSIVEVLTQNIPALLDGAVKLFMALVEAIPEICEALIKAVPQIITAILDSLAPLGDDLGTFFTDCWNGIKDVFKGVGEWFNTNVVEPIKNIFSPIAEWFNTNVVEPIKNFFSPLVEFFTSLFTSIWEFIKSVFEVIGQLAEGCVVLIQTVWGIIAGWFNENVVQPISNFFTGLWNTISSAAKTAWDFIAGVWNVVAGWFNEKIISPVSNFFSGMWEKLKTGASNAWSGIKSVFSKVATFFGDIFGKAWEKVKKVFSTGGKVFDGIKDGIVSAFKNVVNAIIRGINKVVAVPFNAINKVLDKIRGVSIAGVKPFKNLVGRISVPEIPQLERGIGLAKKGLQFLLEGNGNEAVVPLDKNKYWIRAVADDMRKQLQNSNAAANSIKNFSNSNVNNFTQVINAPKQPSRIELYRQTKNLINLFDNAKGGI